MTLTTLPSIAPVVSSASSTVLGKKATFLSASSSQQRLHFLLDTLESAKTIIDSSSLDDFEPIPLGPNVSFFDMDDSKSSHIKNNKITPSTGEVFGKTLTLFSSSKEYYQQRRLLERQALLPPLPRQVSAELHGVHRTLTHRQEEHHQLQQEEKKKVDENCCASSVAASESNMNNSNMRQYQEDQWNERFQELAAYQQVNGTCDIFHDNASNRILSQWIKRQRYQYKLKISPGKHSTLTDERQSNLDVIGFVWDAHGGAWDQRLNALKAFRERYGHCKVPSKYEDDRPLAVWVKYQRHQMKLRLKGKKNALTEQRVMNLINLDFDWNPRNLA
jgi:hypothetical protein